MFEKIWETLPRQTESRYFMSVLAQCISTPMFNTETRDVHFCQNPDNIQFNITIQNRGLKDSDGDVLVDAVTYTNASYILDYTENIGSLAARDTAEISISLVVPGSSENGTEVGFLLT